MVCAMDCDHNVLITRFPRPEQNAGNQSPDGAVHSFRAVTLEPGFRLGPVGKCGKLHDEPLADQEPQGGVAQEFELPVLLFAGTIGFYVSCYVESWIDTDALGLFVLFVMSAAVLSFAYMCVWQISCSAWCRRHLLTFLNSVQANQRQLSGDDFDIPPES
jgi:hypothetical protein